MENRNGLVVQGGVSQATGTAVRERGALDLIDRHRGGAMGRIGTVRSHGRVDSALLFDRVELFTNLETTMPIVADRPEEPTAIRTDLGAMFVSMELSRSNWLITSLSPGNGEKMSKHAVRGGDVAGLMASFSQLREKAQARKNRPGLAAKMVRRLQSCFITPICLCH